MKALAAIPEERDVRILSIPEPRLESPEEVMFRPLEVGICGTDRDLARFRAGAPPPGLPYLVLGHEAVGEVVEAGPEAGLRKGDLVVPTVRRPCAESTCMPCRTHQSDMCFTGRFRERGIHEAGGFMTELVVEHPHYLTPVPSDLREVAVLLEPLTIVEKALLQVEHIQKRLPWECPNGHERGSYGCRNALVLGAGPVGFLGAMALAVRGMNTCVASRNDADDPKAKILEKAGMRYFSTRSRSPREVADAIGNVDLIFEAAGSSEFAFEYLPVLGVNGIYVMTGVPGTGNSLPLDVDRIMHRLVTLNQAVLGVVNANIGAFRRGIESLGRFVREFPELMGSMITSRSPLEEFRDHLLRKPRGEIKAVFTL